MARKKKTEELEPFFMVEPEEGDKVIFVEGPDDLRIEVDYDDVDGPTVLGHTKRMVEVLNEGWRS